MKSTRRNFLKLIPSVVATSILPAQPVVKSSLTEEALDISVGLRNNNIVIGPLSIHFAYMRRRAWNSKVYIDIEGSLWKSCNSKYILNWLQDQYLTNAPLLVELNGEKRYQMLLTQYDISNDLRMISTQIMLTGIQI